MIRLFSLVCFLLCSTPVLAQELPAVDSSDGSASQRVVYDARTEIDMERLKVDGENTKRMGVGLMERTASQWRPLLALKADFHREIAASASSIR